MDDVETRMPPAQEEVDDTPEEQDDTTPEEQHQLLVKKLREKHGNRTVFFFDEELGTIAYRSPKRGDMKRFMRDGNDDNMDSLVVMETLLQSCRIHPTAKELANVFEELPGHASEASRAVLEIGRTTGRGNRGK